MQGSIFDYWQAIVGLIAVFGVGLTWRQLKSGAVKTDNAIEGGNRNTQEGGAGQTSNRIKDGDDNQQSG